MSHTSRAGRAAVVLALLAAPALAQQVATPTESKAVDEKSFKVDAPGTYANADLSYVLTSATRPRQPRLQGGPHPPLGEQSIGFAAAACAPSSSPDRGTPSAPRATSSPRPGGRDHRPELLRARPLRLQAVRPALPHAGRGWERNRFSGLDEPLARRHRRRLHFVNSDRTRLPGTAGITYTNEEYTVEAASDSDSFVGPRAGWDLRQQLFHEHDLPHTLIADENLEDTDDLRVDAQSACRWRCRRSSASRSNWRLLWDNQPALAEYDLYTPGRHDTGLTVVAPYKELDQGFSVSLVFSFAPPKKG